MTKNIDLTALVAEKIKTSPLGEIIGEEELRGVVADGIQKAFFEPRYDRSGYNAKELPPLIVEVIRECLREEVAKAVREWMTANADRTAEFWREVLDQGIERYVEQVQTERGKDAIRSVLGAWIEEENKIRIENGMPCIYL